MNHFKKGGKVALLGENYFPPINNSHMTQKRGLGIQIIMDAILNHKPSVIYICPTKGVNINLIPLIMVNDIKFRLIFPSKSFFTYLNEDEKEVLDLACQEADKIVILSEGRTAPMKWADDWFKGTKRAVDSADWVLVAHDAHNANDSFGFLMEKFEGNSKPVLAVDFGGGGRYQ